MGAACGVGARGATGASGKGRGVASTGAAGATGRGGVGAVGIGAVSRVGPAAGGGARRCGTREPPKTPLEPCEGAGRGAVAAGAAGRGAGFGACGMGGVSPVPRGKGPAMKVVWGGRPHCT